MCRNRPLKCRGCSTSVQEIVSCCTSGGTWFASNLVTGKSWTDSAYHWRIPDQAWSIASAEFGRSRARLGRCWAYSGRHRPRLDSGPDLVNFGRSLDENGRSRPNFGRSQPEVCRILANLAGLGRACPKFERSWHQFGPNRPVLAQFQPNWARIRPNWSRVGRRQSNIVLPSTIFRALERELINPTSMLRLCGRHQRGNVRLGRVDVELRRLPNNTPTTKKS